MFVVGLFSWWYGEGWKQRFLAAREYMGGVYDYFSIDLLARTLFAPFRQISAGKVSGPVGVQMQAIFDQLISRTIGATVRTILIFTGVIALIVSAVVHLVIVIIWGVVPLLPIFGLMIASTGWVPWHI